MLETNFNIKFEDNRSPDEIAREIELHQCRRKLRETEEYINHLKKRLAIEAQHISPSKIIRNNRTTIVIWNDGTKTIVRCEPHKNYDAYEAFTAALAKKIYGNNTRLKKMILEKFTSQT